jgi:ubiquitin-protein ligase
MSNISVIVSDVTGAKRNKVSLPASVTVRRFLGPLITKLELPTQESDGRPLVYKLHHKQSGKTLAEEDTLTGVGVAEGDTLQLIPQVTAGAGHPRLRRLRADWQKMQALAQRSSLIHIDSTNGSPPERYVIRYTCKGIARLSKKKRRPIYSNLHYIEIILPASYPFGRGVSTPQARYVEGSAWHPNIYADGTVCYGTWHTGQSLDELALEIGEIIQYRNCHPEDAANGEAATWARQHRHLFPVDDRPLIDGDDFEIFVLDDDEDFDIFLLG